MFFGLHTSRLTVFIPQNSLWAFALTSAFINMACAHSLQLNLVFSSFEVRESKLYKQEKKKKTFPSLYLLPSFNQTRFKGKQLAHRRHSLPFDSAVILCWRQKHQWFMVLTVSSCHPDSPTLVPHQWLFSSAVAEASSQQIFPDHDETDVLRLMIW